MNNFSLIINNSFCAFSNEIPNQILDQVRQLLTYHNDIRAEKIQLLNRMQIFKKRGLTSKYQETLIALKKLEASEYVCWLKGLTFPTGHLNIVLDFLNAINSNPTIEDLRKVPKPDFTIRWRNEPHVPRYFQEAMISLGLSQHRGVFEAAVGSGKSLVMMYLIKNLGVKSLIVVPSSGLKEQLYRDFIIYFGIENVQKIETQDIRKSSKLKNIRITTIQTLASLQKTGDLQKLVSDIKGIYLDENHHTAANSYCNILPEIDNIYYRFGFTGTFLRNDSHTLDMWGFLSTKLFSYPAYKAIADGFLTPIEVYIHKIDGKRKINYMSEYKANYCNNPLFLQEIHDCILNIEPEKQILILVNRKDQSGKIIHEYLKAFKLENSFISGDDTATLINNTIDAFNKKKIRILIGSSVIGEGINICSTDHLLMCQGGKSEIIIVQALGRVARLFEGKITAYVHDFNFTNTKYLSKHLGIRKNIYKNNIAPKIMKEV